MQTAEAGAGRGAEAGPNLPIVSGAVAGLVPGGASVAPTRDSAGLGVDQPDDFGPTWMETRPEPLRRAGVRVGMSWSERLGTLATCATTRSLAAANMVPGEEAKASGADIMDLVEVPGLEIMLPKSSATTPAGDGGAQASTGSHGPAGGGNVAGVGNEHGKSSLSVRVHEGDGDEEGGESWSASA